MNPGVWDSCAQAKVSFASLMALHNRTCQGVHFSCWSKVQLTEIFQPIWPPQELLSRDTRWWASETSEAHPPVASHTHQLTEVYIYYILSGTHPWNKKTWVVRASNWRKSHGCLDAGSYPCQLCCLCRSHKESRLPPWFYLWDCFFSLPGQVLRKHPSLWFQPFRFLLVVW